MNYKTYVFCSFTECISILFEIEIWVRNDSFCNLKWDCKNNLYHVQKSIFKLYVKSSVPQYCMFFFCVCTYIISHDKIFFSKNRKNNNVTFLKNYFPWNIMLSFVLMLYICVFELWYVTVQRDMSTKRHFWKKIAPKYISKVNATIFKILHFLPVTRYSLDGYRTDWYGYCTWYGTRTQKQNKITINRSTLYGSGMVMYRTVPVKRKFSHLYLKHAGLQMSTIHFPGIIWSMVPVQVRYRYGTVEKNNTSTTQWQKQKNDQKSLSYQYRTEMQLTQANK